MNGKFRWFALAVLGGLFSAASVGVWLLVAWQVIVVGLETGPRDLVAVSAAGVASGFVLLVVHELGHAATGRAVGLPLVSLTLVVVRIARQNGRLVLKPNTRLFRPAAVVCHSAAGWARWRVAAMVAGGPVANLLLAGACLVTAATVNSGPPPGAPAAAHSTWRDVALVWPGSVVVSWLNITGLVSLQLGTLTLVRMALP